MSDPETGLDAFDDEASIGFSLVRPCCFSSPRRCPSLPVVADSSPSALSSAEVSFSSFFAAASPL